MLLIVYKPFLRNGITDGVSTQQHRTPETDSKLFRYSKGYDFSYGTVYIALELRYHEFRYDKGGHDHEF